MRIKALLLISIFVIGTTSFAQEKEKEDETLDTERVVIVKAYTPTISDAFKIKSAPVFNDSITQQKKEIRYSIFSVPVASTYTPQKGRAANIDRPKPIKIYDNYATLGFGNFTSVLAEFYSNFQINRSDNLGLYLHHNSSQGGIEEVQLDDKYYNTFLDANYTSRTRDYTYGIEAGVEHQLYNWYGLPETPLLTPEQINAIDPQQSYFGAKLGGKLQFDDLYFKKASFNYRFFGDALNSVEHHVIAKPTFEFEMGDNLITTHFIADYLNGSFERDLTAQTPNTYGVLNLGVHPNLVILRDNLTVNLGAAAYYSIDTENKDNNFFLYPKITASYRVLEENVIAYGGVEGELQQNTYRDAVQKNPYVSPTLIIEPTSTLYDAYIGIKGQLSDVISYNFRGSYISEDEKPLFVTNTIPVLQLEGYDYGNSFSYRYDDVTTLTGYGELNFEINKKFKLGVSGQYFSYDTEDEQEAWNLPEVKASVLLDYQINKQWYAGAQLFYVGERKDVNNQAVVILPLPAIALPTVTLDSYFDANINLGYRLNDQLSFFIKGNNLIGDNYQRWVNYPVQGIQFLGGATYKFDY